MFSDITIILVSYIVTLGLTVWVRQALLKRALLDHPNERSSHKIPVPRGGGWAILITLIPGIVLTLIKQHNLIIHAGLIVGVLALALISWIDDRKGASVRARLSIQLFAACIGSMMFTPQDMLLGGMLPFPLDRLIMIIGWVWFMNLYNFMDGIDGITGVETISIATGTCLVMTFACIGDPFISTLTLLLTGACLGFLALNWHPAKIFLGDVGSVPLGYLTGYILIALVTKGHLAAAVILPLYYLADSGITILRRLFRGEKVWQAHRQHFYQHATQGTEKHGKVVLSIAFANVFLIGCGFLSLTKPAAAIGLAILITGSLLCALHKRGTKNVRRDPAI